MLPVGMVLSTCCLLVTPWADQACTDQGCGRARANRGHGRSWLHHLPRKGATSLSGSGRDKAKVELPWDKRWKPLGDLHQEEGARREEKEVYPVGSTGETGALTAAGRVGRGLSRQELGAPTQQEQVAVRSPAQQPARPSQLPGAGARCSGNTRLCQALLCSAPSEGNVSVSPGSGARAAWDACVGMLPAPGGRGLHPPHRRAAMERGCGVRPQVQEGLCACACVCVTASVRVPAPCQALSPDGDSSGITATLP